MAKAGRKGLYEEWLTEESLTLIQGWKRDGLTDEQIAKNIGVRPQTICEWKAKFPQFAEALKEGKDVADRIIENALFKSAKGYDVVVRKPMKLRRVRVKDGMRMEDEEVEYVEETIHIPANVTAQLAWLKHRKPEVWGDAPAIQVEAPTINIIRTPRDEHKPKSE